MGINREELVAFADMVTKSITGHRLWINQVHMAVAGGQPLTEAQFVSEDAHHECCFGRLLGSLFELAPLNENEFSEISRLHRAMHDVVRKIALALNAGRVVPLEDYAKFLDVQHLFFDHVLHMHEVSVVNKHQFDQTTDLINRQMACLVLSREQQRMDMESASQCCVAIADLDRFKRFNDRYGHDVGDLVLKETARVFKQEVRYSDTVARYGGEEFLFILPDTPLAQATVLISRIREALAQAEFRAGACVEHVTASFGISALVKSSDVSAAIKCADISLYRAKAAGRNRVCAIDSSAVLSELKSSNIALDSNTASEILQRACATVTR